MNCSGVNYNFKDEILNNLVNRCQSGDYSSFLNSHLTVRVFKINNDKYQALTSNSEKFPDEFFAVIPSLLNDRAKEFTKAAQNAINSNRKFTLEVSMFLQKEIDNSGIQDSINQSRAAINDFQKVYQRVLASQDKYSHHGSQNQKKSYLSHCVIS